MNFATFGTSGAVTQSARVRLVSLAMALLLAAATLLLVQDRADASPASAPAAAAAIAGAGGVTAQIDIQGLIQSIVCPILLAIRNAFAQSPFFGFVEPIINQLLAVFGCTPSP